MDPSTCPSAASDPVSGIFSEADSRPPSGKIRSACNRCHSQKLRCIRKPRHISCERCLKLKTTCQFGYRAPRSSLKSPIRATSSPSGNWHEPLSTAASILTPSVQLSAMAAHVTDNDWFYLPNAGQGTAEGQATVHPGLCNPAQGDSADMQDMYWTGNFCEMRDVNLLDYDELTDRDVTLLNENIVQHAGSLLSPGIPDSYLIFQDQDTSDQLGSSHTSTVQKLASLNVELHECASNLPSTAEPGISSSGSADNGVRGPLKGSLFAIDELLRLTNDYINVVTSIFLVKCETSANISWMAPKQPGAQFERPPAAYSHQLWHASRPVTATDGTPPSSTFSQVDEAIMLMIASCHFRLTEIYSSVFQLMQVCIKHSLVPKLRKDWAIVLPQLQVGSLTAPLVHVDVNTPLSSASKSMYMLMITILSSQLWEQVADVVSARTNISTNSASASSCALADMVWGTVTDRTGRLSQTIDATMHLLQRYSVVTE